MEWSSKRAVSKSEQAVNASTPRWHMAAEPDSALAPGVVPLTQEHARAVEWSKHSSRREAKKTNFMLVHPSRHLHSSRSLSRIHLVNDGTAPFSFVHVVSLTFRLHTRFRGIHCTARTVAPLNLKQNHCRFSCCRATLSASSPQHLC